MRLLPVAGQGLEDKPRKDRYEYPKKEGGEGGFQKIFYIKGGENASLEKYLA